MTRGDTNDPANAMADGGGDSAAPSRGAQTEDADTDTRSHGQWPHLTRRRTTVLAAVVAGVGLSGWLTRPAPVRSSAGWRRGADLPAARGEMKAATLAGRIYLPGGLAAAGGTTDRLDVYDPAADAWTDATPMPTGLNHHATTTTGGRLYVVGGTASFAAPPGRAAFAYEPGADTWTALPDMPDGRWGHEAVALDGRVYVVGGLPRQDDAIETLVYDPEAESWKRAPPIPTPREHVAASAVDGEVVVVSGRWAGEPTAAVESYDPETDQWRERAPIPTARGGFGATVVDGAIHAVGGEKPALVGGWTTAAHERYDPVADEWASLPDAPLVLHGNAVAGVDDSVFVFGGAWRQGLWSATAWSDATFAYDGGGS